MNTETPIGPAIRDAYRFIRGIHKDALAVLQALDAALAEKGWYPTYDNRISEDLRNGSDATRWILRSIYRLYVNSTETRTADRILAAYIAFDPPDCCEEPVCLCIVAEFPTAVSTEDMWKQWKESASFRLLECLTGPTHTKSTLAAHVKVAFPQSKGGDAFYINLCTLESSAAVQAYVIEPLFRITKGTHGQ